MAQSDFKFPIPMFYKNIYISSVILTPEKKSQHLASPLENNFESLAARKYIYFFFHKSGS